MIMTKNYSLGARIHQPLRSPALFWHSFFCLMPAAIWSIYLFGVISLVIILSSLLGSLAADYIGVRVFNKQGYAEDGSSVFYGLLIAFGFTVEIPIWIPFLTAFLAIFIVKWSFGGTGYNWIHPVLFSKVFVMLSFSKYHYVWRWPRTMGATDSLGISPLSYIKRISSQDIGNPMAFLSMNNYPRTQWDGIITGGLNKSLLEPLGVRLPEGYFDLILGNTAGTLGEVSALLLLIGAVYIIARGIVDYWSPLLYTLTFSAVVFIFGGIPGGNGLFSGDILFHLASGATIFGGFYILTDFITSPDSPVGRKGYAILAGIFASIFRLFTPLADGVVLGILAASTLSPLFNRLAGTIELGIKRRY